jgi:hypothetical protein
MAAEMGTIIARECVEVFEQVYKRSGYEAGAQAADAFMAKRFQHGLGALEELAAHEDAEAAPASLSTLERYAHAAGPQAIPEAEKILRHLLWDDPIKLAEALAALVGL